MITKQFFGILLVLLATLGLSACDDDNEPQDKVETIKMLISAETSTYQPWGSEGPVDCMLVKEEHESEYKTLGFQGISDFDYEKGYEYTLLVEKRTLINPPADGSNIAYKLMEILANAKVEYIYTIETDAPNPFILSSEGGKYEIPFTCKRKIYKNSILVEDKYAPLKGLRYSEGTNCLLQAMVVKDGEKTGYYKFMIEGIPPYNMKVTPWQYFGIYPADADLLFGPEPEPIYKQLLEQPQTEGEDYFIYPIIWASMGTFDF